MPKHSKPKPNKPKPIKPMSSEPKLSKPKFLDIYYNIFFLIPEMGEVNGSSTRTCVSIPDPPAADAGGAGNGSLGISFNCNKCSAPNFVALKLSTEPKAQLHFTPSQ